MTSEGGNSTEKPTGPNFEPMGQRPEDLRAIFAEYGIWSRHYHNLTWVTWAFASSLAMAVLTQFSDLGKAIYTVLVLAALSLLFAGHQFAERHRSKWRDYLEVQNRIEAHWGIRDSKANPDGHLAHVQLKTAPWRVQRTRRLLSFALFLLVALSAFVKWTMDSGETESKAPYVQFRIQYGTK